jgi:hypothetical protein
MGACEFHPHAQRGVDLLPVLFCGFHLNLKYSNSM